MMGKYVRQDDFENKNSRYGLISLFNFFQFYIFSATSLYPSFYLS
jgi:hypothetical protein